jgi:N-acetylglucosaminyldiphosphoundecaprenol N-acetyl-beta-D-mannosaminyltransferase
LIDQGKRCVVGVMVDAVDYEAALERIMRAAREHRPYSVSALAVHGVMTGVQSDAHKFRLNSFDLLVPDGQPVRWALNAIHGANLPDRVFGTELTLRTLEAAAREQLPVYFYGSTPTVLTKLVSRVKVRHPSLIVAGTAPSKFRSLDLGERNTLAERIRASGAAIIFVALGCPKQEVFAFEMRGLLPMPVLAVGAAFPFIAGEMARAPEFMQRNGLEWVFRLMQEPCRLWRRYLLLNPYYLLLLAGQFVGMRYSTSGSKPPSDLGYG